MLGELIGLGSSLIGGLIGSSGAKKAAAAQAAAINNGITTIKEQAQLGREDLAPWRTGGAKAFGTLSDMIQPGYDYTTSPGYQFRLNEGRRALEGSAAARGMLMSGGTLKALTRYGQDYAANDYNDQFNRVALVSGQGLTAADSGARLGADAARSIADLYTQGGNAKASGYAGSANAWQNTLGDIAGFATSKTGSKAFGSIF